jgi:hypothetical protein
MKTRKVDAVIALDDYDVEKAALIRETFVFRGWDRLRTAISEINLPCDRKQKIPELMFLNLRQFLIMMRLIILQMSSCTMGFKATFRSLCIRN